MTLRRLVIVLFGIAIIPLIYAGALTWANQDPTHRLDRIQAAIVNEDTPAAPANGGDPIDLGSELVEELTTAESGSNFTWVELGADEADERLTSGQTLVVLTVPPGFSANVASVEGDDPTRAQLEIRTNDAVNQIVGTIAATIGAGVTDALSDEIRESYLTNIYLGFTSIHEQVLDAADGASKLATGATDARAGAGDLVIGLDDLAAGSSQLAAGAGTLRDGAAQADTGAQQVAVGAAAIDVASGNALAGAQSIQTGADQLAGVTSSVSSGAAGVSSGLNALQAGYATMTDEQRLAAIAQLLAQADATSAGAAGANQGAASLAGKLSTLVGSTAAGTGLSTLQLKAHELSGGASSVATGTTALVTGANSLQSGADEAASGAADAAAGASSLSEGLEDLETGAVDLADGLADGADDIPTYSDSEAADLAAVSASPVELQTVRENEVPWTGYALAPYFITLAMWVGALAFYLMFPALREKLLNRGLPAWLVALRSYLPGAAMAVTQSLFVVVVMRFAVGIQAENLFGLAGLVALTSLTFVAINQALIAIMGPIGRFIALVFIVFQLASAGATYPIQTTPDFFQAVHSWLPFTYSVEAFRSLIAGGSVGVGSAVLVLALWLLAALGITTLAVTRAQRTPVGAVAAIAWGTK